MHKLTRIAFNSSNWHHPTGEARKYESSTSYNYLYGFGHEDWLFRSEWLIDGWRYAFLQGVNKSHKKLVKTGQPFDVTLFSREPDGRKRFVATIREVDCLGDQEANDALDAFKARGWYDVMLKELLKVGVDAKGLSGTDWAPYLLNIRFRMANVMLFPPDTYADANDPIKNLNRYQLYDLNNVDQKIVTTINRARSGSTSLPEAKGFTRRGNGSIECTPEHARMQRQLMEELIKEYPTAKVVREQDCIDVTVRTEQELILFEIKSDLSPLTVIRLALGQILEYAYHPSRKHDLPMKLVIVGRQALSSADVEYMSYLQRTFGLPLRYRVVSI